MMKIEYRCGEFCDKNENSQKIMDILEEEKIECFKNGRYFYFCLHSDNHRAEEILGYLKERYSMEALFSNEEMENANWYTFEATRHDIETSDFDFTFKQSCPFQTELGTRYWHTVQVNPYVSKRIPKWKNNYNFCSVNTGDFYQIFCSDIAKTMIKNRGIKGIDFMPVINKQGLPTQNVSQLVFSNILPREAFDFIGEYREIVCPFCAKIRYSFIHPMYDNMRVKTDLIPPGIDAFSAEMSVREGWIVPPVIVSKKIYNLVSKEMKEKHVRFYPIG